MGNNRIGMSISKHGGSMKLAVQSGDFDLHSVVPERIFVSDIMSLRNVCRFGGHTPEHYSVIQHSVLVMLLVDQQHCLQALLHDAPEAYLGDVPTPLKKLLGAAYSEIEERVWLAVASRFSVSPTLHEQVIAADRHALYLEASTFGLGAGWREQYREPHLPLLPLPRAEQANVCMANHLIGRLVR